MVYADKRDLPLTIRAVLTPAAQELYVQAYHEAWAGASLDGDQTARASAAHQLAWDAVTRAFVHDERTQQWYRRGAVPVPKSGAMQESDMKTGLWLVLAPFILGYTATLVALWSSIIAGVVLLVLAVWTEVAFPKLMGHA